MLEDSDGKGVPTRVEPHRLVCVPPRDAVSRMARNEERLRRRDEGLVRCRGVNPRDLRRGRGDGDDGLDEGEVLLFDGEVGGEKGMGGARDEGRGSLRVRLAEEL